MKNIFYHDGCDICSNAGVEIITLIGLSQLDIVHVGMNPNKELEAKNQGVKAFPALVTNSGNVLHFNVAEHEGSIDCLVSEAKNK